jgi:non-homologous end joining protein Ku
MHDERGTLQMSVFFFGAIWPTLAQRNTIILVRPRDNVIVLTFVRCKYSIQKLKATLESLIKDL